VSFLANLLPGLRDLRTPLAVGYIWILDLWLCWPAIPSGTLKIAATQRLQQIAELVGGPPVVILGLAVAAYTLGILVGALGQTASETVYLLVVSTLTFLAATLAWAFRGPILAVGLYASANAVLASVFGVETARWRYLRVKQGLLDFMDNAVGRIARVLRPAPVKVRAERTKLLLRIVDETLSADSDLLRALIASLDPLDLARAWECILKEMRLELGITDSSGKHWSRDAISGSITELRRRRVEGELRNLLEFFFLRNGEARLIVYMKFLNLRDHEYQMHTEMRDLPIRLKAQVPDLHNAWDQVNAEAEFRSGIAGPILLLGPAVWASIVGPRIAPGPREFVATQGDWIFLIVLAITSFGLAMLLVNKASERRMEAEAILVTCLRSRLVEFLHPMFQSVDAFEIKLRRRRQIREHAQIISPFEDPR
jgi:hypothetical protein